MTDICHKTFGSLLSSGLPFAQFRAKHTNAYVWPKITFKLPAKHSLFK